MSPLWSLLSATAVVCVLFRSIGAADSISKRQAVPPNIPRLSTTSSTIAPPQEQTSRDPPNQLTRKRLQSDLGSIENQLDNLENIKLDFCKCALKVN
jgi:hypothetical protein